MQNLGITDHSLTPSYCCYLKLSILTAHYAVYSDESGRFTTWNLKLDFRQVDKRNFSFLADNRWFCRLQWQPLRADFISWSELTNQTQWHTGLFWPNQSLRLLEPRWFWGVLFCFGGVWMKCVLWCSAARTVDCPTETTAVEEGRHTPAWIYIGNRRLLGWRWAFGKF